MTEAARYGLRLLHALQPYYGRGLNVGEGGAHGYARRAGSGPMKEVACTTVSILCQSE